MKKLKFNPIVGVAIGCLLFFSVVISYLTVIGSRSMSVDNMVFQQTNARLGKSALVLEIADDLEKISHGLSYRRGLAPAHGMLFIGFAPRTSYALDESRMNFSTDVVWLRDNQVVALTENIQPQADPLIVELPVPADAFLELAAGQETALDIKAGDLLIW